LVRVSQHSAERNGSLKLPTDNPWNNAKSLAIKAGRVLASVLLSRPKALGERPVTLVGYSLGALVILTALSELAGKSPSGSDSESGTAHIIGDVFLFGTPAPADAQTWARARRVVAGRLVNAYTSPDEDYVLAVLGRVSISTAGAAVMGGDALGVAGLQPVEVAGVENIRCEGVRGHVGWREMVGRCLEKCGARGLRMDEVKAQEELAKMVEKSAVGADNAAQVDDINGTTL